MALVFEDFAFDQERRQLLRAGQPVRLEPKAYELLGLLLERRPKALSKAQIRDVIWPTAFVSETALTGLVTDIRTALGDDVRQSRFIRTIHGFGYAFCGEAQETDGRGTVTRPSRDELRESSPYPGLASFTEADAARFFGREAEVEALLERIRRQKLLVVIGPSGVGKTSFVRAGVVASRPADWGALVMTPGGRPFAALAQGLSRESLGDTDALAELIRAVADQAAEGEMLRAVSRWRRKHAEALLVIDQFEELFTQTLPETQERFARLLRAIAEEAEVRIVLSMRDDLLFRCLDHDALLPFFEGLVPLRTPSQEGLLRAVKEPARKEGYGFEDEALAEEIVQAVARERGGLPLLAFAVSRLWEKRDRERKLLTREAYRETAGVEGALAQHAEATLEAAGPDQEGIVREIFRNLTTAQGTRASLDREELLSAFPERGVADKVLRQLVDARLLTSYEEEGRAGETDRQRIEIVHESLLKSWPRLVRWQTQDADGAQLRDQVRQAARLWHERRRPAELLWTGASFLDYRAWRARYPGGLSTIEEEFAREMGRFANRRRRRRIIAAGAVLAASLAVAAVTAGLWRRSERERAAAEAARLVALGQLRLDDQPSGTLAYALASLERLDTEAGRRLAVEALWRGPTEIVFGQQENVYALSVSDDGRWIGSMTLQEGRLWSSEGGPSRRLELGRFGFVQFSQDSPLAMTSVGGGPEVRIWALPPGAQPTRTLNVPGFVFGFLSRERAVTYEQPERAKDGRSPHGTMRSWSLVDGSSRILPWDGGDRRDMGGVDVDLARGRLAEVRDGTVNVRALDALDSAPLLSFSSVESAISWQRSRPAVVTLDRQHRVIRLWSVGDRESRLERVLRAPGDEKLDYPTLDPKNRFVVAASRDRRIVRLWDLLGPPDAEPLALLDRNTIGAGNACFEPRGGWLASAHINLAILWALHERRPRVLRGHPVGVTGTQISFSTDGRFLVSASADEVRLWPLTPEAAPGVRVIQKGKEWTGGNPLLVDPSGRFVVVSDMLTGRVLIIPLVTSQRRVLLQLPTGTFPQARAINHDGTTIVVCTVDRARARSARILLWDPHTGAQRTLDPYAEGESCAPGEPGAQNVRAATFLRNGSLLTEGQTGLRLWDTVAGTSRRLRPCIKNVHQDNIGLAVTADDRTVIVHHGGMDPGRTSEFSEFDLVTGQSRSIVSHGPRVYSMALDPSKRMLVTGDTEGVVRAGPIGGEAPHLLYGHSGAVQSVAVSPDGRWIASAALDGTIRLWPMPEGRPFHTLPYEELLTRLRALTNLRAVADPAQATGYKIEVGPFPGWETLPTW